MMANLADYPKRWLNGPRADLPAYLALTLWALTMMALPIARWIIGDSAIPAGVTIAALMQATAVFLIVQAQWGSRATLRTFVLVAILTWLAEAIGSKTGIPFGEYSYTDVLQPQLSGVPMLIPIAWFMLLPAAWAIAQAITNTISNPLQRRAAFVVVSAMALTAWDLFLDPQMVGWGFWVWANPVGYFGIPWVNYMGWLLVSGLVTFIVNPAPLRFMPLALVFGMVCFFQTIGQAVFWNQPGPAFFGCLAMGSLLLLAIWRKQKAADA